MIEKVCSECKKKFEAKRNVAKFCSKKCANTCNNRGRRRTQFSKERARIAANKYYASSSYSEKRMKEEELRKRECMHCGNTFLPPKKKSKYCSLDCFNKEKARCVKGEISTRTLRKIIKRAFPDWKCPFCRWSKTWHIHHIRQRRYGIDNSLMNLVILCPNHHSLADLGEYADEELEQHAIGKFYTEKELLSIFYFGDAKEFAIQNI